MVRKSSADSDSQSVMTTFSVSIQTHWAVLSHVLEGRREIPSSGCQMSNARSAMIASNHSIFSGANIIAVFVVSLMHVLTIVTKEWYWTILITNILQYRSNILRKMCVQHYSRSSHQSARPGAECVNSVFPVCKSQEEEEEPCCIEPLALSNAGRTLLRMNPWPICRLLYLTKSLH